MPTPRGGSPDAAGCADGVAVRPAPGALMLDFRPRPALRSPVTDWPRAVFIRIGMLASQRVDCASTDAAGGPQLTSSMRALRLTPTLRAVAVVAISTCFSLCGSTPAAAQISNPTFSRDV